MDRSTGCVRGAVRNRAITGWPNIRATHACARLVSEGNREVVQPVGVRPGVIVNIGDYFTGGILQSDVASGA
jgi:hypothetical protein